MTKKLTTKADQLDLFGTIEPVQKQKIQKRIKSASKSQKIIKRLKSQLETFRYVETIKTNKIKIKAIEYDCAGIFGNFADPIYDVARVRFIFKKDILLKREMRLAPFDSNILLYKEEYDPSGQIISFTPHEKLAKNFVIEKNILRLDKKDDWYGEDDSEEDYLSQCKSVDFNNESLIVNENISSSDWIASCVDNNLGIDDVTQLSCCPALRFQYWLHRPTGSVKLLTRHVVYAGCSLYP